MWWSPIPTREAIAIGRRAYRPWRDAIEMLWKEAGTKFPIASVYPDTFDELLKIGNGVAGAPSTVRDTLQDQAARGGLNYVACQLYFGDMSCEEAQRSASLFAEHVAVAAERRAARDRARAPLFRKSKRARADQA